MAKRKSLSIKPGRARGLGTSPNAKCRAKASKEGAVGTAAIAAMADFWRKVDNSNASDGCASDAINDKKLRYVATSKPFADPKTFAVKDSPEAQLRLKKIRWLAQFNAHCDNKERERQAAYDLRNVKARAPDVIVLDKPEPETCPVPARVRKHVQTRAEAMEHAQEMAKLAAQALARAMEIAD